MVEVSAAIIRRGEYILICQRPADKGCALLWEFPGGKREANETHEQCLIRECSEELGITIAVDAFYDQASTAQGGKSIALRFYLAHIQQGEPIALEHADVRWVLPEELGGFVFCPADTEVVNRLQMKDLG